MTRQTIRFSSRSAAALDRRQTLKLGTAALALIGLPPRLAAAALKAGTLGPPAPFSFDRLAEEAADLASRPYADQGERDSAILDAIDYDAFNGITFRRDASLWGDGEGPFPVRFFPLGRYARLPVRILVVENGQAREVLYSPDYFSFSPDNPFARLPEDAGFAGFRVMNRGRETDWLAFLGAAYFRSAGELDQYGLSARGVAVDTAMPTPEEFPRFTRFYLESAAGEPDTLIISTLMDGPRITGAYRMVTTHRGKVTMEIDAQLFCRAPIGRLGAAPLTSMFWYSETRRPPGADYRPEIHDSDGLALWTGAGERIWRPINNPPRVMVNAFADVNPKGFGLVQRDRNFEDYQDDGVFYERRPTVWVEPLDDWGEGAVELAEIPTDDEIHDNIVAFWRPKAPVEAGQHLRFRYRLHWVAEEPYPPTTARVVQTRTGIGGIPGQPRPPGVTRIAVDFRGAALDGLTREDGVEAVVTASRGKLANRSAYPLVGTDRWRALFDLTAEGSDPVDLRMFLKRGDTALSETWIWQYFPEWRHS